MGSTAESGHGGRAVPLPQVEPGGSASRASDPGRRRFMQLSGVALAAAAAPKAVAKAEHEHGPGLDEDRMAVLVDLTLCVGCRRCEWACNEANGQSNEPLEAYDDQSVMDERRRPRSDQFTVVNRAPAREGEAGPLTFKLQCMHCEKPACVSACLVGAMEKQPDGPVTYDASKCIGCRYCMVACPHQLLTYEYDKALTPRVRKCELCRERTQAGGIPACVEICPVEALVYGRRRDLLKMAHERINRHGDRYVDHVYGETEAGGASWLYLSDRPFSELGLPELGPNSPANVTESIQHGIFKGFAAPILLGGLLLTLKRLSGSDHPDPAEMASSR